VGTGFWITQVILVVAAIVTGIYVERSNRAEKNIPPANAPKYRVSVEETEARVGAHQFTAAEQSRLSVWRRLVEQARELRTDLVDDLQADMSSADEPPETSAQGQLLGWRKPAAMIGMVLVVIGSAGAWQAITAMTQIEQHATGAVMSGSLTSHLLPGVVANPGKYLAAVNSSSGGVSGGRDPIQMLAWLDEKEAVDRFEAVIGVGLACLLAGLAGWPSFAPPAEALTSAPRGSIGSDILPFILCASVFLAAMSFFELP
jgi:hypothetical protein